MRVLVDGIDVTDTSGPQVAYDFGSLRTADVSRIEILRGNQGALYGSESIGGVVNITTRRATEEGLTTSASIELGSYNTLAASYGLTMKQGDMDYALTLSSIWTDGFSAADENDGNDEADGYRVTDLRFGSHAGTHVDAPAHTEPDGRTLDSYPVSAFAFDAVRVDCRDLDARDPILADRVPGAAADCVVFRTGWDRHWGTDRYRDHPYLTEAAAARCRDRGVGVGVDAFGPDPTPTAAASDEPDGTPAHDVLLSADLPIVENLCGLDGLPARFRLYAFPLRLRGGDGSPVRAVAEWEE